jgi:hypothetical protein
MIFGEDSQSCGKNENAAGFGRVPFLFATVTSQAKSRSTLAADRVTVPPQEGSIKRPG